MQYFIIMLCIARVWCEDYVGAVPCPTNTSIMGYTNLTVLNADIFSHFSMTMDFGSSHVKYTYVLCPETTFVIEQFGQTIIPATDETTFSCGLDGSVNNNCVIKGGDFQVFFLDLLSLINIEFRGITFEKAEKVSIYGDAHPSSTVSFLDCIWLNHDTVDIAYIHFTPNTNRRLIEGEKYEIEQYDVIQKYEAIFNQKRMRDLQIDRRYSMMILFDGCLFKNNDNKDSVIYGVGAEIAVYNTTFVNNTVDMYAVFVTTFNGHAYLGGTTQFVDNKAALGAVFISSDSFLQYSEDTTGSGNLGDCGSIFIEEDGSECIQRKNCNGTCCEFDDVTCDFHPDPEPESIDGSSQLLDPTGYPSSLDGGIEDEYGDNDSVQEDLGDAGPKDNDVESGGPVSNELQMDSPTEDLYVNECTGFCLAVMISAGLFGLLVLIWILSCLYAKYKRKLLVFQDVEFDERPRPNNGSFT